jgi:hypothetical protein
VANHAPAKLPTCASCKKEDQFAWRYVPGGRAVFLVYCTSCGHIVGPVMSDEPYTPRD